MFLSTHKAGRRMTQQLHHPRAADFHPRHSVLISCVSVLYCLTSPAGMLWRAGRSPWTASSPTRLLHSSQRCRAASFKTTQGGRSPGVTKHSQLLQAGSENNSSFLENDIRVSGLIRSVRKQKKVAFAHLADGTTLAPIQAILSPELAADLTNGAFVELTGRWQASPGKGQAQELQVSSVQQIGPSNPEDNPIQKQHQTNDFLRTIPHLRMRTTFYSILARTRSHIIQSAASFFNNAAEGAAVEVQPPLITSSDCEGAGEVFTVAPKNSTLRTPDSVGTTPKPEELYFREPKYLTVSSQLHLEAYSAELGDVWALSPTFRAEESDTPRHLSEFYMLEAEFRGIETLDELMARVQRLIQFLTRDLQQHQTGLELLRYYSDSKKLRETSSFPDLEDRWDRLLGEWEICSYSEVIEALQKAQAANREVFKNEPDWLHGLQLEHEKWAVEHMSRGRPLFITDYPQAIKPFYMLPSPSAPGGKDNITVACFDLLLPFGYCEVVGGSLREHRLKELISNMRRKGLLRQTTVNVDTTYPFLESNESLASLEWYVDLRRFGSSPHGGFGVGFDRLLGYLTGVSNVRDVVAFPRTWGRADC